MFVSEAEAGKPTINQPNAFFQPQLCHGGDAGFQAELPGATPHQLLQRAIASAASHAVDKQNFVENWKLLMKDHTHMSLYIYISMYGYFERKIETDYDGIWQSI